MNYLSLNVAFGVTKCNQIYFVDYVRVNSKERNLSKFMFEYNEKSSYLHPIVEKKIAKSKGKQEVCVTLSGHDVGTYFNLATQKFEFNGKELKELEKATDFYSVFQCPDAFIKQFEKEMKKKNTSFKLTRLLERIKEESDKAEIIKILDQGYDEVVKKFIEYFSLKRHEEGKRLFSIKDSSDLLKFIKIKVNYYTNFTSASFQDAFNQILYFLTESQSNFIKKWNPSTFTELIDIANLYHSHLNSNSNSQSNSNVRINYFSVDNYHPIILNQTKGLNEKQISNLGSIELMESLKKINLPGLENSIDKDYLPENWMNECSKKGSSLEEDLICRNDKSTTNKVFTEKVESITQSIRGLNPLSMLKSFASNKSDQLQTNTIDSTSLINKDVEQPKFNNHDHIIDKETGLPIIRYKDKYEIKDDNKAKKDDKSSKRKLDLDSTFYQPPAKHKQVSCLNLREKKQIDYKEISTDESMNASK